MKRVSLYIVVALLLGYMGASFLIGRPAAYPLTAEMVQAYSLVRDTVSDTVTAPPKKRTSRTDSVLPASPQTRADTLQQDSVKPHKPDTVAVADSSVMQRLDAPVDFGSNDSIVLYPKKKRVRMYGDASVKFREQALNGDYMDMQTDSGTVFSTYIDYPDSLNKKKIYAKIQDGSDSYEAHSISYNFHSKKGFITDVITRQGEGYITASKTKRMASEEMYMEDGKYTTCTNHAHPHFYIQLTKAKVRPKKNIVSGPLYLVFADVPLPIGLPFAFFPFTQSKTSGILPPTYGDEMDRGFYLRNGGYYFAINDYVDAEVTGDIYTKGSWGLNARSNYRKRYRYSGGFDASYIVTKRGDKVSGDYSKSTDIRIAWNHRQDQKANPYRVFSANVNFSTSSYNHNNLDGIYNQAVLGQNTKSSSVSFSQRFPNSPFSISGSLDVSQRSRDSAVTVTAPNLTWNMSRIFPFKRKKRVGKELWYEKISMSYSGQLRNYIDTKEDKFFKSNLIKDWRNGISHSIPVSASFDLFNYFKITPSFNYQERWYTSKVQKAYDPTKNTIVPVDTTYGFYRVYDFSTSLSFSTTVYGFWKPLPIFGDYVNMIRHRIEPSVSLSYRPDFGDPRYGYWTDASYLTPDGRKVDAYYSPFEGQFFGTPGRGKSGSIGISVNNNLEAKVKDKADSTSFKKISLIDGLSFSTSYNMAADSFQWSDLSASLRLRLSQSFTLNLNGVFDVYTWDYNERDGRVYPVRKNKLRAFSGKGIGRLRSTSTSFSYSLNPQTLSQLLASLGLKKEEKQGEAGAGMGDADRLGSNNMNPQDSPSETPPAGSMPQGGSLFDSEEGSLGEFDSNGYLKNQLNWNFGFSYSMSLGYGDFNPDIREYKYKLRHDLSFNGQFSPTKNWNFNFSANYNFDEHKITNMTCNITRDLHCWAMTASFIPLGPFKSYNFSIAVKSSLLQDLKYRQSSQPRQSYNRLWK